MLCSLIERKTNGSCVTRGQEKGLPESKQVVIKTCFKQNGCSGFSRWWCVKKLGDPTDELEVTMRKERRILDRLNKTNLNKQNANRQNLHSAANYYPPSLQNTRPHFCLEGVHCRKEHKYIATLLVIDPDFIRDLEARKNYF